MRRALLLALLALPLAGFDCGGPEAPKAVPCTVTAAGGATETLWCIAAVYDYSQLSPPSTEWALDLVAYRSMTEPGVGIGFFLPTRAAVGTGYGWDSSTGATSVDSGTATRYDSAYAITHEAVAPLGTGDMGTGKLSAIFTSLPPPGATGAALATAHGTIDATLPSPSAGAAVTVHASF